MDKPRINVNDFVGKTIKSLDFRTVNEVVFHFTDDTSAALEIEAVFPTMGLYGITQVVKKPVMDHNKKRLPILHE